MWCTWCVGHDAGHGTVSKSPKSASKQQQRDDIIIHNNNNNNGHSNSLSMQSNENEQLKGRRLTFMDNKRSCDGDGRDDGIAMNMHMNIDQEDDDDNGVENLLKEIEQGLDQVCSSKMAGESSHWVIRQSTVLRKRERDC